LKNWGKRGKESGGDGVHSQRHGRREGTVELFLTNDLTTGLWGGGGRLTIKGKEVGAKKEVRPGDKVSKNLGKIQMGWRALKRNGSQQNGCPK